MKKYSSFSVDVDLNRIYDSILNNKHSIGRYKDFILKRIIKLKLITLINNHIINENDDFEINIFIDEQLTATNGIYSLSESLSEELLHGIENFNYGHRINPILFGRVLFKIRYCDSSKTFLIQASDVLANRIFSSYKSDNPSLRTNIPNHTSLLLP